MGRYHSSLILSGLEKSYRTARARELSAGSVHKLDF
jgi:hypothetical protein